MKISTAIKQIQKDAQFLGMDFAKMVKFIQTNPMAQTQKTLEAYKVIVANSHQATETVA